MFFHVLTHPFIPVIIGLYLLVYVLSGFVVYTFNHLLTQLLILFDADGAREHVTYVMLSDIF